MKYIVDIMSHLGIVACITYYGRDIFQLISEPRPFLLLTREITNLRRCSFVITGIQCTERRHLAVTDLENDVGQPVGLPGACLSRSRIETLMDQDTARHLAVRRKLCHTVLQKIRKLIESNGQIDSRYYSNGTGFHSFCKLLVCNHGNADTDE
jgi:hypothetical protein